MSLHLRILLIVGAAWFLGLTIYYIKRKHMDLYHSIRWFAGAVIILIMAVFPDLLGAITNLIGMELPSNLVFLLMILILRVSCFSFPVGILAGLWVCVITLWSGVDYFVRNRSLLR